jgi:hypothetical protein
MSERFYLLNIELLDIELPIWRRFVVPGSITLDRLTMLSRLSWAGGTVISKTNSRRRLVPGRSMEPSSGSRSGQG